MDMNTANKCERARNECPSCMKRLWMFPAANMNFVGYTCPNCQEPLYVQLLPKQKFLCWAVTLTFVGISYALFSLSPDPSAIESARLYIQMHLWAVVFLVVACLTPQLLFPWWFGRLKRDNKRKRRRKGKNRQFTWGTNGTSRMPK